MGVRASTAVQGPQTLLVPALARMSVRGPDTEEVATPSGDAEMEVRMATASGRGGRSP
jgi:hypothetical protein